MATDLKLISDLHFAVLPRPQQCPRLLQIRFIERLGSAAHATPTTGGLETCVHPLTQYVTLKLRKRGEDVKCKLTARSGGVDVFGEGMELNPVLVEHYRGVDKLAQRPG